MRFGAAIVVLAVVAVLAIAYVTLFRDGAGQKAAAPGPPAEAPGEANPTQPRPVPVALNRGPDVRDGFRGDVHPLLVGQTRLRVTAHWTPVGKGRDQLHRTIHPQLYAWFTDLRPSQSEHTYTARDFSAFLPETVGAETVGADKVGADAAGNVGQCWAIDPDRMIGFLKQFHPRPSLNLVAAGRRAGPDGAFALLRAVSPTHLDIVFRLHAEFYLTPQVWPAHEPLVRAWYTPAYLSGRVLVNQRTGQVDHFRLGLPADKSLNVHLTTEFEDVLVYKQARDVVRVDRMELIGGDSELVNSIAWTRALDSAEADRRLARIFYKFLEIDWTPFDQAAAQARSRGRPIFAVVSWGSFEDQSC